MLLALGQRTGKWSEQLRGSVAGLIGVVGAVFVAAVPATAQAPTPSLCNPDVAEQALVAAGKLTPEDVGIDLLRCGDMTNDGAPDALFTLASGGTAGDIQFGVLKGNPDGSAGPLVLFKSAYQVGVFRRNSRSFEVIQPHFRKNDANCCPSSFRIRRYSWDGARFKGGKSRKVKHAPRRFYRP
jgi:hypothetical protein